MASSLLSSSLRLRGLVSIFRSPNLNFCGAPMMMSTTASVVNSPPWLMLPPAFESGGDMVYKFYSLAENKVVSFNNKRFADKVPTLNDEHTTKIVGSSHGWLALFNERNCDLFLSNPITGRHVKLPPIHNLPIPQDNLDGGYGCVSKVIISCDDVESEECRAMMIFNTSDTLALCCPCRSTEWTPIGALRRPPDFDVARGYEDLVYSSKDKLFFCLTKIDSNDLEGWDILQGSVGRTRTTCSVMKTTSLGCNQRTSCCFAALVWCAGNLDTSCRRPINNSFSSPAISWNRWPLMVTLWKIWIIVFIRTKPLLLMFIKLIGRRRRRETELRGGWFVGWSGHVCRTQSLVRNVSG